MRILQLSLVMLMVAGVSACGKKGDKSVDENGNCTSLFIDQYNHVKSAVDSAAIYCRPSTYSSSSYLSSTCLSSVQDVLNACTSFTSTHPANKSCKAMNMKTWEESTVSAGTIHSSCAELQQSIAQDKTNSSAQREAKEKAARESEAKFNAAITLNMPTCEQAKATPESRAETRRKLNEAYEQLNNAKLLAGSRGAYGDLSGELDETVSSLRMAQISNRRMELFNLELCLKQAE